MQMIRNLTGTLLIAGMASMAYAWSPRSANAPMNQPASAAQQDQQAPKQDDAKPPRDTKDAKAPRTDRKQTNEKQPGPNEKQPDRTDKNQPRDAKDQPRQDNRAQQHPAEAQRGQGQAGGAHGRIRDNDYKAHFGRPHSFRVRQVVTTTRIVPNQTRFVYSGYTFVFLAPWPSAWMTTDDCYIDYVDGQYVLIDPMHPGMTIALQIVE